MSSDINNSEIGALAKGVTSRRSFLRAASLTAVGTAALAACGKGASSTPEAAAAATPPVVPPPNPRAAADAMDAMHEKGIKSFPAKTVGKGNQLLTPRVEKGVKI